MGLVACATRPDCADRAGAPTDTVSQTDAQTVHASIANCLALSGRLLWSLPCPSQQSQKSLRRQNSSAGSTACYGATWISKIRWRNGSVQQHGWPARPFGGGI